MLGVSKATLCIHLSIRNLAYVEEALTPHYGADCPVVIVYRATWPDEQVVHGTVGTLADDLRTTGATMTALVLVGDALATGERALGLGIEHLVADGPLLSHRRTRAGDAVEAGTRPTTPGVLLGMPRIGAPA